MLAERIRAAVRPAVRLRAVPPLDPPFDDEMSLGSWLDGIRPAEPRAARPIPDSRRPPYPGRQRPPGPGSSPTNAPTPDARWATRRFLGTCLEVLNGYRPVAHLRPLLDPAGADAVTARLTAALARLSRPRHRRTAGRPAADLFRVRRLRVCEPRHEVVEAAAVLEANGRTRAIAFRLERRRGSWIATAIELP